MLKVGIHCEGCAKKVRKVLNKIEGKKLKKAFLNANCLNFFVYVFTVRSVCSRSTFFFSPLRDVLD